MKLLELVPGRKTLSSRLVATRVEMRTHFALADGPLPPGAALLTNFKADLIEPKKPRQIAFPSHGGTTYADITGQQCCDAFFRELRERLRRLDRKITDKTRIRVSEPAFQDHAHRRNYQEAVKTAAQAAGFANIELMTESDAVFEYFRILRRDITPVADRPLSVLVIDFGGGTCNVSAVTTTKTGELWARVVAPLAADAPRAGGMQIDRAILTRGLRADIGGLDLSDSGRRAAFNQWRDQHLFEAEAVKVAVSKTRERYRLRLKLDGRGTELAPGRPNTSFEIGEKDLEKDALEHWTNHIRVAVDAVLKKMHDRLTVTARRSGVGDDPREIVTHVLLAGGSSQLPGFLGLVKEHFAPHQPIIRSVGADFPFAVAAGMALNYLSQAKLLRDTRSATETPRDLVFLPTFESTVLFFWRPDKQPEAKFQSVRLFASEKSPWEILQDGEKTVTIPLPKDMPKTGAQGRRIIRSFEYQVGYEVDEHASLVSRRFGRLGSVFDVPPDVIENRIDLTYSLHPTEKNELELVGDMVDVRRKKSFDMVHELVFLRADVTPATTPNTTVQTSGSLMCGGADLICIDFGTTNTTVIDLADPSEVFADDFIEQPAALSPQEIDLVRLVPAPDKGLGTPSRSGASTGLLVVREVVDSPAPPVKPVVSVPRGNGAPRTPRGVLSEQEAPGPDSEVTVPVEPALEEISGGGSPESSRPSPRLAVFNETPGSTREGASEVPPSVPVPPPPAVPTLHELLKARANETDRGEEVGARRRSSAAPARGKRVAAERSLAPPAKAAERPGSPFEGEEEEFLDYVVDYAVRSGLSLARESIETTYLSMKVRPLVILAGPSGVGKTSLARVMWEAAGASIKSNDAIRIAVEAHWTDARYLLGRKVQGEGYIETDLLRLLRRAAAFPDRHYHALVDEMNLAHVEYYFAQFLSAMEADGRIVLPDLPEPDCHLVLPMVSGQFPLVRFYGTVNVDETTQIISDKVIDRANVIELDAQPPGETVQATQGRSSVDQRWHLTTQHVRDWGQLPDPLQVPPAIREVWQVLANAAETQDWVSDTEHEGAAPRLAFGRRIVNDVAVFVEYARQLGGESKKQQAVDWQVKQRILPKLRGDLRIRATLEALSRCLKRHALLLSSERLDRMIAQLDHDQFVTFWD